MVGEVGEEEAMESEPFQLKCGIRFGKKTWWREGVTFPFGQLSVTDECLELSSSTPLYEIHYRFQRSDCRIKKSSAFLSRELWIEHSITDYPPFITVNSFQQARLVKQLKELGYVVS